MKTIVITGASSGVGLELAAAFTRREWKVVGLARGSDKLAEVQRTLGERFEYIAADIRDPEQVGAAFASIGARHGTIDVLVNNAAVFKMGRLADAGVQDVNNIIDTNLKGTIFCTMAALKWLRPGGGRIVNIGSVAGTHGIKHQALYCASKFGMDGFAEALNQELVEQGVSLTTIAPGGIDTPLWDPATNPYSGELEKVLKPGDVVSMVEYVADLPQHVLLKKVILFPTNEWH